MALVKVDILNYSIMKGNAAACDRRDSHILRDRHADNGPRDLDAFECSDVPSL